MRHYSVDIMTNRSRTLGITGNIVQRVRQHKEHINEGFTTRYRIDRLVYYETVDRLAEPPLERLA